MQLFSTDVNNMKILKQRSTKYVEGLELASKVSTKEPYFVGDERHQLK
jgi:carbamoyl-phosphate synthase small subunit